MATTTLPGRAAVIKIAPVLAPAVVVIAMIYVFRPAAEAVVCLTVQELAMVPAQRPVLARAKASVQAVVAHALTAAHQPVRMAVKELVIPLAQEAA